MRFLPPDAGKEIFRLPADFLATRPDSRFLIPVFARRGAVARPAGHLGMLTQPITLVCTRRILRATHFAIEVRSALSTVQSLFSFERRLITRASEISWAVAWWSQSSARPILILGRRSPIPAGAWCRGLNGMPASDAAWRRPAATPQAVVGAAQRCSQRHVCSFAVGSAV